MMSQQSMQDQGQAPQEAEGGFTIEIEVDGQGNITVSSESVSQEDTEGQGEGQEDNDRPVGSIKEALALALQIYKSKGQMSTEQQDQQAGFNSVSG